MPSEEKLQQQADNKRVVMRSLASKRVASRWTLLRLISRSASSSLQRKKNAPIALAAQLLDQDIELVLDDTDGAGADLHEAEPAGFDEAQRGVGKISLEVFFRPMSLMSYMGSSSKGPTTVACGTLFSERCRSMNHFSTSVS